MQVSEGETLDGAGRDDRSGMKKSLVIYHCTFIICYLVPYQELCLQMQMIIDKCPMIYDQ